MANEPAVSSGAISASTMEAVLALGNLKDLTVQQRLEYYVKVCETIGLNPLTRPFRFMSFQGEIQLYATKDCAEQLRKINMISVELLQKDIQEDLFIVTARATTKDGRQDDDVGATVLTNLRGEAKANAIMKAITKAKRRVTLSICGLGYLDETEVETLQGARTFAPEDPVPAQQPQITHSDKPTRQTVREPPPQAVKEPATQPSFMVRAIAAIARTQGDTNKLLRLLPRIAEQIPTMQDLADLRTQPDVKALENGPSLISAQVRDLWRSVVARLAPQPNSWAGEGDFLPDDGTPPDANSGPSFEAVLFDENGDPVSHGGYNGLEPPPFTDPLAYAKVLRGLCDKAFPPDVAALLQHNADGIAAARTYGDAAAILDAIVQETAP